MKPIVVCAVTLALAPFVSSGAAVAACESPMKLMSPPDNREVRFHDRDGDGATSTGDKRLGYRVLTDEAGNSRGEYFFAVHIHKPDDGSGNGETTNHILLDLDDGAIFGILEQGPVHKGVTNDDKVGLHPIPAYDVIGGLGAYVGAKGTVEFIRDDPDKPDIEVVVDITCD
jgi:hypothetical protein